MTGTTLHIPTLETERLILRAPRREDFRAFEAFFLSPRSGVKDPTPRAAWRDFCAEFFGWTLGAPGHWVIEHREHGADIGIAGFSQPSHYPEPEMGWSLYDGYEGRGYATEAACAARDWARNRLASLVSYIRPGNERSIAVADRLGAVHDPDATLPDGATHRTCAVYRHWGSA